MAEKSSGRIRSARDIGDPNRRRAGIQVEEVQAANKAIKALSSGAEINKFQQAMLQKYTQPSNAAPGMATGELKEAIEFWKTTDFDLYVQDLLKTASLPSKYLTSEHQPENITKPIPEQYKVSEKTYALPVPGTKVTESNLPEWLPQSARTKETKSYVSAKPGIIQPKYLFTLEGQPVQQINRPDKFAADVEEIGRIYKNNPYKKAYNTARLSVRYGFESALNWIGNFAVRTKEISGSETFGGPGGLAIRLIYNAGATAIRGVDYGRRVMLDSLFDMDKVAENYRQNAASLEAEIKAGKWKGQALIVAQQNLEYYKKAEASAIDGKKNAEYDFRNFSEATQNVWKRLVSGEGQKPAFNPYNPEEKKAYYDNIARLDRSNKDSAVQLSIKASTLAANGDFDGALSTQIEAVETRWKYDIQNPLFSYSWDSLPESREAAIKDIAFFELQTNRPATIEEIRNIKKYHENMWVELTGEIVFDPLNLIPAEVFGVAAEGIGAITGLAGKGLRKIPVIESIFKEAHSSVASRVGFTIAENVKSVALATGSDLEKFQDGIHKLGQAVLDAHNTTDIAEKRAIFEAARTAEGSPLVNLSFDQFKAISDAIKPGSTVDMLVDPAKWSDLTRKSYDDVYALAKERETARLIAKGVPRDEAIAKATKLLEGKRVGLLAESIDAFSREFADNYRQLHKIFRGSSIMDDTVAATVAGGKQIGKVSERALRVDQLVKIGEGVRTLWATAVLNLSPSRILRNLYDSLTRAFLWGSNPFDDVYSLWTHNHALIAEKLGVPIPLEMSQSLARMDLGFSDTVASRLLYEGWKPEYGVASYWEYEVNRLKGVRDAKLAKEMAEGVAKKTSKFGSFLDNLKIGLQAVPNAAADYNTAIEFTLRLRMFNKKYTELLKVLEPQMVGKTLETLSPELKEIARAALKASDNPAKLQALIDSITTKSGKLRPSWSFLFPDGFGERFAGDPAFESNFISRLRRDTEQLIEESVRRTGKYPTPAEWDKFIDKTKAELEDGMSKVLAESIEPSRAVSGAINTEGKITEIPKVPEVSARTPEFKEAVKGIVKKPFKKASTDDILSSTRKATESFADVVRKGGAKGVKTSMKDGRIVIEVGDDIMAGSASSMRTALHESIQDSMWLRESEVLSNTDIPFGVRFDNQVTYKQVLKEFLADPLKLRNENASRFLIIARQVERNPEFYDLLKATGKVQDYGEAARNLREYGYLDALNNMSSEELTMYFKARPEHGSPLPTPPQYVLAGDKERLAHGKFMQAAENKFIGTPIYADVQRLSKSINVNRSRLHEFMVEMFPGPKKFGGDTTELWRSYFDMAAEDYLITAEQWDTMSKMSPEDLDAYLKRITINHPLDSDEGQAAIAEYFLSQNRINIQWSDDGKNIIGVTLPWKSGSRMATPFERADLVKKFFSKYHKPSDAIYLNPLAAEPLLKQFEDHIRVTFGLNSKRASAVRATFDRQARWWADVTGQPAESYFSRFGFVPQGDYQAYIKVGKPLSELSKGIIHIDESGKILFYGAGTNDFPEFVRKLADVYYQDLYEASKFGNPEVIDELARINKALGVEEGFKLTEKQLDQFRDAYASYHATGTISNPALKKPFSGFSGWLKRSYGNTTTSMAEGLSDEVRVALDKVFTDVTSAPPSTRNRLIEVMAEEMGVTAKQEDVVAVVNQGIYEKDIANQLSNSYFAPAGKPIPMYHGTTREFTAFDVNAPTEIREGLKGISMTPSEDMARLWAGQAPNSRVIKSYVNADPSRVLELKTGNIDELKLTQEELDKYDVIVKYVEGTTTPTIAEIKILNPNVILPSESGIIYKTADDLLASEIEEALYKLGGKQPPGTSTEIKKAWTAWRENRDLVGFNGILDVSGKDILDTPESFISYLKDQINSSASKKLDDVYHRFIYDVEQFQEQVIDAHQGANFKKWLYPPVHEFQVDEGVKRYLRLVSHETSRFSATINEVEKLRTWFKDGKYLAPTLPKDLSEELANWAKTATGQQADMISTIMNGGKVNNTTYKGIIKEINDVMIDYNYRTRFDVFARNFIPFWTFPSRSWPFWVKTLATHPTLIAGYQKIKRLSETARYQAGAITSSGKPLPSLDGYIPVPGTDLWFNPLAPISATYVLGMNKSYDDIMYEVRGDDDTPPMAWLAKEFIDASTVYGFSVAPWISGLLRDIPGFPSEQLPQWPIIPHINLIPRWMIPDMIRMGNIMTLQPRDAISPEVSWHDYLIEKEIYLFTNQQLESLEQSEGWALANKAADAVKYKDTDPELVVNDPKYANLPQAEKDALRKRVEDANKMWDDYYKRVTNSEAGNSMNSFLSGFFTKRFSDVDADLMALRNQSNILKSAMNSKLQSQAFGISTDAEEAWDKYLAAQDTPEGWLYKLYTDSGYVRNAEGDVVNDPEERAKLLAIKIQDEENNRLFYQKLKDIQKIRDEKLASIPVGSDWDQIGDIYEWYGNQYNSISNLNTYEPKYGTNKPVELIESSIEEKWYKYVWSTRPLWNEKKETFDQWQGKVTKWEESLDKTSKRMIGTFMRRQDIQSTIKTLHPDQKLRPSLWGDLVLKASPVGLKAWQLENDSLFDALNTAWSEMYWKPYWEAVGDKKNAERELAEHDFYQKHPEPPSGDELFSYIRNLYGDKFSYADVMKWTDWEDKDAVNSITDRVKEKKAEDYDIRQDIWKATRLLGPGKNAQVIAKNLPPEVAADWQKWFDSGGSLWSQDIEHPENAEKLAQFRDTLWKLIGDLDIKSPDRAQLIEFIKAEEANNKFHEYVSKELGVTWETFDKTLDTYYNESRRDFLARPGGPEAYKAIKEYNVLRQAYAQVDPIWASYYLWKPKPSGLEITKAAPGTAPSAFENPTKYSNISGIQWPVGMRDPETGISPAAVLAIEQHFGTGQSLSRSTKNYLERIYYSHPVWGYFILPLIGK